MNATPCLYHVSPTRGIKVLSPKASSHGKAYVYAIDNLVAALLFGAKKTDFDFLMDVDDSGRTIVYECYPHAFQKVYTGKSCSVYEVDSTDFQRGITGWEPEWVCEHPVSVRKESFVANLYDTLMKEVEKGSLVIQVYSDTPDYQHFIENELGERMV